MAFLKCTQEQQPQQESVRAKYFILLNEGAINAIEPFAANDHTAFPQLKCDLVKKYTVNKLVGGTQGRKR